MELASGKDYYSSEKAGFGFWEWRERCWSPIFFYLQPACCGPDYRGTPHLFCRPRSHPPAGIDIKTSRAKSLRTTGCIEKKITLYLRGYLFPASGESRWPERFRAPDHRNLHKMSGSGIMLILTPNLAAVVLLAGVGLAGIEPIVAVYSHRTSEDGLLSVEVDYGLRGCYI